MKPISRAVLLVAGLIALNGPWTLTAQPSRAAFPVTRGWVRPMVPRVRYEGITRSELAFATAQLAEIEGIFRRIPALVDATEFRVRTQYFGGTRPVMMPKGAAEYSFSLWFFARFGPGLEFDPEGCRCIQVFVNEGPRSSQPDEHGLPIFIEADPGEPIPGATVVYRTSATRERDEVHADVIFTRGGVFPWEAVSREEYLRAQIHGVEGLKGEKTAGFRKALEQTTYEAWMAAVPERKKARDDLAVALRGNRTPEEIASRIAAMEATEREVTEQLKAQDAEDRRRNQEILAKPTYGDLLRAQIEAMSPEERRRPAMVEQDGQLLPLDARKGSRVLRSKLEFWRVRRSPVEVHSITVSISGATGLGQTRDVVIAAIQQTFRNLDWGALKRMVDAEP